MQRRFRHVYLRGWECCHQRGGFPGPFTQLGMSATDEAGVRGSVVGRHTRSYCYLDLALWVTPKEFFAVVEFVEIGRFRIAAWEAELVPFRRVRNRVVVIVKGR